MVPPSPQNRSSPVDGLFSGEVPLQALDFCDSEGRTVDGWLKARKQKQIKNYKLNSK